MINVIVELSKYVILTLMVIYTFHCFYMVKQQSEEERNESLRQQLMLIFFMDFTAFLVIYLKTDKFIYTYNIEDMAGSTEIGNVYDRLVPVVDNYTPDNTTWVLVDVEEDTTTKKR